MCRAHDVPCSPLAGSIYIDKMICFSTGQLYSYFWTVIFRGWDTKGIEVVYKGKNDDDIQWNAAYPRKLIAGTQK